MEPAIVIGAGPAGLAAAAMLFSTPEFIFVFLPAALLVHYCLARRSPDAAIVGTTI